jgi:hypothetical protein
MGSKRQYVSKNNDKIYTWVIINRTLNIIIFHNFIIIYVKNHNYKYCTTFNFINNAKGSFL